MLGPDMLGFILDFVSQGKYPELLIPSLECDEEELSCLYMLKYHCLLGIGRACLMVLKLGS